MGASKKSKKSSTQGATPTAKGNAPESVSPKKTGSRSAATTLPKSAQKDAKSPKDKSDSKVKHQATPQEMSKNKNKKASVSTPSTPPVVVTPPSSVRRSSRAPVPSSRFKDMEMSSSSRKRSLASSQSEESDGDAQPPAKKIKKVSDKSSKKVASQEEKTKAPSKENKESEDLDQSSNKKSKSENVGKTDKIDAMEIQVGGTEKTCGKEVQLEGVEEMEVDSQVERTEEKISKGDQVEEMKEKTAKDDEPKEAEDSISKLDQVEGTEKNIEKEDEEKGTKEKVEKDECGAAKDTKIEMSSGAGDVPVSVEVAVADEAKVTAAEEAQGNVEEVSDFESTTNLVEGIVVEEMVQTIMDEKDAVVVKKVEQGVVSPSSLTSPAAIAGEEEAKKSSPLPEIRIRSQDVTLEEKDGKQVAIIKVPSNFGSNESVSTLLEGALSPDAGKEKITHQATKTSPVNKNRHGYILNKASEQASLASIAGHDAKSVVSVPVDHTALKSVLNSKTESTASKKPVTPHGRVLKQEPSMSTMVIKSPRQPSEIQGGTSNIIIQNVAANQSYSLLPQTIKAVSQTEGKTYSLLAPPSELKQILKGVNEQKSVVQASKSADSPQLSSVASPPPQKVIIIAHPSTSESAAQTSSSAAVSLGTTDSATVTTLGQKEKENSEEISQGTNPDLSSLTTVETKGAGETSSQAQVVEETLNDKEEATGEKVDISNSSEAEGKVEDSAELVISTPTADLQVVESGDGEERAAESTEGEKVEENSQSTNKAEDSSVVETKVLKSQQIDIVVGEDGTKPEVIESTSEKLPMEEVVVTSTDSPVIKVENQEEGGTNPSVNVLSQALAEVEKNQGFGGTFKPQRIKLIENGVVYELEIFPEGEGKTSQEAKGDGEAVTVKQEITDEGEIAALEQDGRKLSSGTQTFYSPRRGRPKSDGGDETEPPVHKLATIVQEGDQKKHYYYVSVVPGKTLVGKYRHSMDPSLPGCMINKIGEYCCKECDYKTDKKANFYKHRRLHTGAKPHLCPVCKYQARTSSNLKRHMGIHEDIREFKCTQCPMSFRQKIHLERHVRYRHEEKRVKCPMCDYVCANEQPDLKMHIKRKHTQESGKTFSCPECKLVVGSRRDLKQHLKFHKDGPELKLFCKECSFVTDCKSRLQRHLVVHSNVKPFQCGVCDYKATQKEHVLRHLRSQHKIEVNKPKRPWKKQIKTDLVDPMQGSTRGDFTCGDKIFACNHCIMRFAKLINLYKHLHTQHSDIMPTETGGNFYCVVCEFSTSSKKNLLVHMRRHNMTDQTPPTHVYSCVLCRYVNPRRRNLFQHMRKKHNIDVSSQVDLATMKEEEVNAVQEGVKVTELVQPEEAAVYTQGTSHAEVTTVSTTEAGDGNVVGGDLAAVANMIKIEDLTRTQGNETDTGEDHTLVIDSSATGEGGMSMIHATSLMQHKAADAIEGLQALAGQAGFIIEEEVQGSEKQQTIVIEQQGDEVLNASGTTLADGSIIISADQGIVEEQITIDETTSEQITQIVESEEAMEVGSGLTSLELTEEQLSSLQHGDMIQIEGQVYLVELTQDPDSPDKQLLSFLPVNQE